MGPACPLMFPLLTHSAIFPVAPLEDRLECAVSELPGVKSDRSGERLTRLARRALFGTLSETYRTCGREGKYWQESLDGIADGQREVAQELFCAHLRPLAPALRTNQDDAGHALAFHALHMPPYVDGFFRSR